MQHRCCCLTYHLCLKQVHHSRWKNCKQQVCCTNLHWQPIHACTKQCSSMGRAELLAFSAVCVPTQAMMTVKCGGRSGTSTHHGCWDLMQRQPAPS